jgi:hypothetical protein
MCVDALSHSFDLVLSLSRHLLLLTSTHRWVTRGCNNAMIIRHKDRLPLWMDHAYQSTSGARCFPIEFVHRQTYIYDWMTSSPFRCCDGDIKLSEFAATNASANPLAFFSAHPPVFRASQLAT